MLYDELKLLKIRDIYCYLVGQFMFRFYHKLLPKIFDEYFIQQNVFHTYGTRNAHLYRLPILKKKLWSKKYLLLWSKSMGTNIKMRDRSRHLTASI